MNWKEWATHLDIFSFCNKGIDTPSGSNCISKLVTRVFFPMWVLTRIDFCLLFLMDLSELFEGNVSLVGMNIRKSMGVCPIVGV